MLLKPKQMMAVRTHTPSGPEGLSYEKAPLPESMDEEVLIRVHAAGVNPADWQMMERDDPNRRYPWTPGFDVSGIIASVGSTVTKFQEGESVYGMLFPTPAGAFAEYAKANINQISHKPKSIDHIESAAMPIAALTAWQALFDVAQIHPGQKILIHAAAGGVGHIAVQLAKWQGTYIYGTASDNNKHFLSSIGVDVIIDYNRYKFEDVVKNVDVVLDPFGGELGRRSINVLRKDGFLVSLKRNPEVFITAAEKGLRAEYLSITANMTRLTEITKLVDSGHLRPHIDKVLPLSEARKALEENRAGHTRGKIVLCTALNG